MVLDYQNVAKSMDTYNIAILFLYWLLDSYDNITCQTFYGTDSTYMHDIASSFLYKDLLKKSCMESGQSESLFVTHGRSTKCGHSGGDASSSGRTNLRAI